MRVARSCRRAAARAARTWLSDGRPAVLAGAALLSPDHRLTDADQFRAASRGRRSGSRTLVVHLGTAEESGVPARVGLVVSKAVGNAVVRNRVKRRLRHLAREHLAVLPGSAVLVVRALPAAASSSYDELGEDLTRCLGRVLS
ncbi:ribonuclease P protein component [Nocardioides sp. CCNWLW216]|uniref:ribonuclease P protein component n=1 Tax=unclassified Nocardioides TaxID=2615069 RepID=UPI003FA5D360